jgi:16S rRNA (cytosine967-C5)-methyltransferase
MRLPPALIGHTEEVLREILRFTGPADNTLSRYFRDHPRLGSRERGVIAEAVYGLLRNKLVYTSFAESGQGPIMSRLALLGIADGA